MSVWLMYDYVFVDVEDNDSVVQLGDTNMVYDGYPDGGAPRKMKKAKDLLEGQDMVLLYLDIADWNPEKAKVLPKPATKFCLGPSTRAITRKPPKDLLDAVTIADQGPPPSELIEHWY